MRDLAWLEKKYWLAYARESRLSFSSLKKLVRKFGSLADSWDRVGDLNKLGLSSEQAKLVKQAWQSDHLKQLNLLKKTNIQSVVIIEDQYPEALETIYDPPVCLYYHGQLPKPDQLCLASVGTRKASNYGKRVVMELIKPVAKKGVDIISGLAYGIDKYSHEAALAVRGQTIAVLGGGISEDIIYPKAHLNLVKQIINNKGAVLSQYWPFDRPSKRQFVARNRIIAGLSAATLVVEAPERSGALITADFAEQDNRIVMAVPGNLGQNNSLGCNELIKQGALPITNYQDIFLALGLN